MRCSECDQLKTCQEPLARAKRGKRVSGNESLASRLLEHAECHEYIADDSEEQKQWMDDLREAARLITVDVRMN